MYKRIERYNRRVTRRKSFVNKANRKERLNHAREFVLKEDTWWNDVIFNGEI